MSWYDTSNLNVSGRDLEMDPIECIKVEVEEVLKPMEDLLFPFRARAALLQQERDENERQRRVICSNMRSKVSFGSLVCHFTLVETDF